jgi:hypothetical protein
MSSTVMVGSNITSILNALDFLSNASNTYVENIVGQAFAVIANLSSQWYSFFKARNLTTAMATTATAAPQHSG